MTSPVIMTLPERPSTTAAKWSLSAVLAQRCLACLNAAATIILVGSAQESWASDAEKLLPRKACRSTNRTPKILKSPFFADSRCPRI